MRLLQLVPQLVPVTIYCRPLQTCQAPQGRKFLANVGSIAALGRREQSCVVYHVVVSGEFDRGNIVVDLVLSGNESRNPAPMHLRHVFLIL